MQNGSADATAQRNMTAVEPGRTQNVVTATGEQSAEVAAPHHAPGPVLEESALALLDQIEGGGITDARRIAAAIRLLFSGLADQAPSAIPAEVTWDPEQFANWWQRLGVQTPGGSATPPEIDLSRASLPLAGLVTDGILQALQTNAIEATDIFEGFRHIEACLAAVEMEIVGPHLTALRLADASLDIAGPAIDRQARADALSRTVASWVSSPVRRQAIVGAVLSPPPTADAEAAEIARALDGADEATIRSAECRAKLLEVMDPQTLAAEMKHDLMISYLSAEIDEAAILQHANPGSQVHFEISSGGHSENQIAGIGRAWRHGDLSMPYYRGRGLVSFLLNKSGMSPFEVAKALLLQSYGSADDPASGGRQINSHFCFPEIGIPSQSSPTGSQWGIAGGLAHGLMLDGKVGEDGRPSVAFVTGGDGAANAGSFFEMMNTAALFGQPLVAVVENDGVAISNQHHTRGPIHQVMSGFGDFGFKVLSLDGGCYYQSRVLTEEAVDHARAGNGPVLIEPYVVRRYGHSSADTPSNYLPKAELITPFTDPRDPLFRLERELITQGIMTREECDALRQETKVQVTAATRAAAQGRRTEPKTTLFNFVSNIQDAAKVTEIEPRSASPENVALVDAINRCLSELMTRDPRMLYFGEDVADGPAAMADAAAGKTAADGAITGKGGVFGLTKGLEVLFGSHRVWSTPLAEGNIVDMATGLALTGWRPWAEIQFGDYIWPAMQALVSEMANIYWRSNGQNPVPAVINVPVGGYVDGSVYHSQCIESILAHFPGMTVLYPSNVTDLVGMMRAAHDSETPVALLWSKALLRHPAASRTYPEPDYVVPIGKARKMQTGNKVTVVTYGNMTHRCEMAIDQLRNEVGDDAIELIDLRSIVPWDKEAVKASVEKTGRLVVVHEDRRTGGWGREVQGWVAEHARKDGQPVNVRLVAGEDSFTPGNSEGEYVQLPQVEDVKETLRASLGIKTSVPAAMTATLDLSHAQTLLQSDGGRLSAQVRASGELLAEAAESFEERTSDRPIGDAVGPASQAGESNQQTRPQLEDALALAVGRALTRSNEVPLNGKTVDDERVEIWPQVNLAFRRIDDPEIKAPFVLRSVETIGLREIADTRKSYEHNARQGRLRPDETEGATFTLNLHDESLGDTKPLLSPGQLASLDVGPVEDHGQLEATLSIEHAWLTGGDAARFLARLQKELDSLTAADFDSPAPNASAAAPTVKTLLERPAALREMAKNMRLSGEIPQARIELEMTFPQRESGDPSPTHRIASATASLLAEPRFAALNGTVKPSTKFTPKPKAEENRSINVGIAVDKEEKGLVVVKVPDADQRSLEEIADLARAETTLALANQLSVEDLVGSTVTVTSVGGLKDGADPSRLFPVLNTRQEIVDQKVVTLGNQTLIVGLPAVDDEGRAIVSATYASDIVDEAIVHDFLDELRARVAA